MNVTYNPHKWACALGAMYKNGHGSITLQKNEKPPKSLLTIEWIHCGKVVQWNIKKQWTF